MQNPLHSFLKAFVLHSFSFAVMSCKVSHLLLFTKRFKAFLSLFVKLLFLPLRVKVSTVPVLRYLLRALVIVVLGMFNILDSSALFCTDSDRVIIDLVTVFDAILTSWQTCEKLQCLYENLMSNNFRQRKRLF